MHSTYVLLRPSFPKIRVNIYAKWQLQDTSYYKLIEFYKSQFVGFTENLKKI